MKIIKSRVIKNLKNKLKEKEILIVLIKIRVDYLWRDKLSEIT